MTWTYDISIIIVNWNTRKLLRDCLLSIKQFSQGLSVDIIVVDNASSDGSCNLVIKHFSDVKLIQNSRNLGFTRACNQGYVLARGKYIFLLNPDTRITDGALHQMFHFLEETESTGAVSAGLYYPDGRFQQYYRRFPTIASELQTWLFGDCFGRRLRAYRKRYMVEENLRNGSPVEQPAGVAIMVKRDVIGKDLFDDNYCIYFSDVDLCRTIYESGYDIRLLIDARIIHHHSKGGCGGATGAFAARLSADYFNGLIYYYAKNESKLRAKTLKCIFLGLFVTVCGLHYVKKLIGVPNRLDYQLLRLSRIMNRRMACDD